MKTGSLSTTCPWNMNGPSGAGDRVLVVLVVLASPDDALSATSSSSFSLGWVQTGWPSMKTGSLSTTCPWNMNGPAGGAVVAGATPVQTTFSATGTALLTRDGMMLLVTPPAVVSVVPTTSRSGAASSRRAATVLTDARSVRCGLRSADTQARGPLALLPMVLIAPWGARVTIR